ncbi:hypothetical protein [Kluyvera genomosp. 3]|uniref:Portal protein n=1 Tax=Kluyvera genomosp. 3 TaxID=2774055 RepID=A0A6G9RIQ9_9ENTR|nr:hypothetical protein [Kluyvera genomosp. 3]QIR26702.1 hypothetical protein GY169_07665 [Kluyvera genomosp. 3]
MKLSKAKEDLILTQVLHDFSRTEDDHATALERNNKSYLFYTAKLPKASIEEETGLITSDYVEPVMYQYVKEALPQLLDSFTEDDQLAVVFRSGGAFKNQQIETLITDNVNKIFLRDNPGYELLETLIKQTLITGDSYAKCFIDESTQHEQATSEDWIEVSELMSQLAEGWEIDLPADFADKKTGDIKGFKWKKTTQPTIDPQTGQKTAVDVWLIRGDIPLIKIDRKLVIEAVEAADIWVDTRNGSDFTKVRYLCHRVKSTVGDAELRGYDPEKLKRAADNEQENVLPTLYFSDPFSGTDSDFKSESTDPKEKLIDILEHYCYSSQLNSKGETRLYQITTTRSELLNVEEVSRIPFVHGQCETLLGSYYGRSFYDVAAPYQKHISNLIRMQMQIAKMSAWPAYQVADRSLKRESLLNAHRPGAIIEVSQIGAVMPFERHQLTDTFYRAKDDLLQSAQASLSSRNGSTDFSNGVDRTSAKTVALGVYQEGLDGNTLSKNIARTLISPLYSLIYQTIRDEGFPLEGPDGQPVEGIALPPVGDFVVDINTSADDLAQVNQITQLATFGAQISQANMPFITPQNVYEMLKTMCKRMDLDPAIYLTDPQQTQDQHAAAEQAEQAFIVSEFNKIKLEREKLALSKDAAEKALIDAKIYDITKNGEHDRTIKLQESLTAQAAQMAANAIKDTENQIKAAAVQVKADEVEVKRKAVNGEIILGAAKHATDITAPTINGVR